MRLLKIFLKIDRELQHYQHTCIFFGLFVVGKLFAIKRKNMAPMVWTSQKEINQSTRNFNDTFTVSSMQDHSKSESHQQAVQEKEHNKALKEGISVHCIKLFIMYPLIQLHELAFYLALNGHPFQDQVKLEKLHSVNYTGPYENESACRDFTFCISKYFFKRKRKKKANDG